MTRADAEKLVEDLVQSCVEYENCEPREAKYLRSEYYKARESVVSALSPSAWQPIETAPKDGTPILVAHTSHCVEEAYYHSGDKSWQSANTDPSDYVSGTIYPHHWMPMPAPPLALSPAERP